MEYVDKQKFRTLISPKKKKSTLKIVDSYSVNDFWCVCYIQWFTNLEGKILKHYQTCSQISFVQDFRVCEAQSAMLCGFVGLLQNWKNLICFKSIYLCTFLCSIYCHGFVNLLCPSIWTLTYFSKALSPSMGSFFGLTLLILSTYELFASMIHNSQRNNAFILVVWISFVLWCINNLWVIVLFNLFYIVSPFAYIHTSFVKLRLLVGVFLSALDLWFNWDF